MGVLPSNLSRVPNLLASQILRDNLTRTNLDLLRTQGQLSSGKRIETSSDDPVSASIISALNDRLRSSDQRLRNFGHASSSLGALDSALGNISDLAQEAKSVALSQLGVGSDAATRKSEAVVIDSLILEAQSLANTQFDGAYLMGGSRTGAAPIQKLFDGFRYVGQGDGQLTDLGAGLKTPITISADTALGALSARVKGDVDLNPKLTTQTRLDTVRGARGQGVSPGQLSVDVFDGTTTTTVAVDLTGARTIGDALDVIESSIRAASPGALAGAYPSGVGVGAAGQRLSVNVTAGFFVTFSDVGGGSTAADLGLDGFTYLAAVPENTAVDLDPNLTDLTTFGDLNPTPTFSAGDIVFNNGGRTGKVTVTTSTTIADFKRDAEKLGLGVRVEISDDGRSLNVVNELSGSTLAIEESGLGTLTATSLGIRSLKTTTRLTDFNFGKGVQIADGVLDPITGAPDPSLNTDFEITLTDGTKFTVDLTPADVADVDGVIKKINVDAAAAGVVVGTGAGQFQAALADGSNGIALFDKLGGGGAVSVKTLNGHAAEDLGLLGGVFASGSPATLTGEDRAKLRVNGLLSTLIDLRDALLADNERGIAVAGERVETDIDRLTTARAVVGARSSRIDAAKGREEDSQLRDVRVRSSLQDLDFIEATTRFSFLQLVQQAGFQTASRTQSLTLLNFLR